MCAARSAVAVPFSTVTVTAPLLNALAFVLWRADGAFDVVAFPLGLLLPPLEVTIRRTAITAATPSTVSSAARPRPNRDEPREGGCRSGGSGRGWAPPGRSCTRGSGSLFRLVEQRMT